MRVTATAAVVCFFLTAQVLLGTQVQAQTTYPTQPRPTQPQPTSPCPANAPCPPPAASQPDTPAPPPTPQAPDKVRPNNGTDTVSTPPAPPETGTKPGNAAPPAPDPSGTQPVQPEADRSPAQVSAGPRTIAAGTTVSVSLDRPVLSEDSQPGETFTATVNQPVQGAAGNVVIPKGAKLRGELAKARPPSVGTPGPLNLQVTSITLPDGTSAPLKATLVSDARPGDTKGEKGNDVQLRIEQNVTLPELR